MAHQTDIEEIIMNMTNTIKRIRTLALVAVLAMGAFAFTPTMSAGAASTDSWIWGITAPQDGWCRNPMIVWTNSTNGRDGNDLSQKDDIFKIRVKLKVKNTIQVSGYCGGYPTTVTVTITPKKMGQSAFFRTNGKVTLK